MDSAMQTVWHQAYIRALETITSLRNHCDFIFERDSKNAKEVKILNAVRPTVKDYVPGTSIEKEYVKATDQILKLDQYKYFNIALDDIHKAQSVPGAMETTAKEGSLALSEEGDKYVAKIVKEATESNEIESTTSKPVTKNNAVEMLEEGFTTLYTNNCKVTDVFHAEVCPKYFTNLRQNLTELFTNNVEMAKKGYVGKYGNALVSIENLLPKNDEGTEIYNILRTSKAIAFAEQIDKVEAYRPEDAFEDALKGLYVFGSKIVRPKEIVVIKTNA